MSYRYMLLGLLVLLTVTTPISQPMPLFAQDDTAYTVTDAYGNSISIRPSDLERIISIGGAVTEILFDLGMGDNIIAVDVSSLYPREVESLPTVGYLRFLSAEPVLAYNPTIIITTEDAGPPETMQLIQSVGIPVLIVPAQDTLDGTEEKIRTVAAGVGKSDEAEVIITQMRQDVERAQALVAQVENRPRVLFVFAGSNIALGVMAQASGAHQMMTLANVENAITLNEGYVPLTSEGVVASAPDIILTTTLSVERVGGIDRFMALPGIALTPAAQNGRVVWETMDDLFLLGFTPRLGDAILSLTYLLHEELPRPVSAVVRVEPDLQAFKDLLRVEGILNALDDEQSTTLLALNDTALESVAFEVGDLSAYVLDGMVERDALGIDTALIEREIRAENGIVYVLNGLP